MTGPEHCILGAVIAHLGFHQRWGARITGVMVVASIVPDTDSLTLLAGRSIFYEYHRTAFHSLAGIAAASLLVAVLALLTASVGARLADGNAGASGRLRRWAAYLGERGPANPLRHVLLVSGVSLLAMAVHLGTDMLFPWPIPLLWPFSHAAFGHAILDWADKAPLVILLAGMFGMAFTRGRTRPAAVLTCAALAAYFAFRLLHPEVPPGTTVW